MAESLICNKKSFRETAKECNDCKHYYDCVIRGLSVALAQSDLPKENLMQPIAKNATQDLLQPLLVPHDYREIYVGDGMTITIDLEDIKKQIKNQLAIESGLMFGA